MRAIVAVDSNWAIGKDGDQLCYLSGDLKHFKELTLGHAVILGRRTLATFPGGKPLKGRRNLILSRSADFAPQGAEVYRDVASLLAHAPEDAFVVGGGSVYAALLAYCDTAYVTKLSRSFPADTWFPNLDQDPAWRLCRVENPMEENYIPYQFMTYERVKHDVH